MTRSVSGPKAGRPLATARGWVSSAFSTSLKRIFKALRSSLMARVCKMPRPPSRVWKAKVKGGLPPTMPMLGGASSPMDATLAASWAGVSLAQTSFARLEGESQGRFAAHHAHVGRRFVANGRYAGGQLGGGEPVPVLRG